MTDEKRQKFILRVSQANPSAMVVVVYDIFDVYCAELLAADTQSEDFKDLIWNCRCCIRELIEGLNMQYELARNFYEIYRFVDRQLITCGVRRETVDLDRCRRLIRSLRDAYAEAAANDRSAPVMKNTDVVYAGMTYGRNDINTESVAAGTNRGFLA